MKRPADEGYADCIAAGAQGIIFGCTEVPLVFSHDDVPAPLFDTAKIHAAAAVTFALQ
jgi:aspartate racemase